MGIIKYIKKQDSHWKQSFSYSGETSLNLSYEILDYLTNGMVSPGEQCGITFSIYKEDYIQAIDFIESQLPLYVSSSKTCDFIQKGNCVLFKLKQNVCSIFEDNNKIDYTVNLYYRFDGRIYLNGLRQQGFSIRDYLVENSTAIEFELCEGEYSLRVLSAISEI